MSADDHLGIQFMPVADLMKMHSQEALRIHRNRMMAQPPGPSTNGPYFHGRHTRLETLYDRKAADFADKPGLYRKLDEPIRSGTIDPVMIQPTRNTKSGKGEEVYEGAHRIIRAHQLGVGQLPVTRGGHETQKHYDEWDN